MDSNLGTSLLLRSLFSVMRKRQLMILRQLENCDRLSGVQLAEAVSASRRTVISDLEEIRQFFEKSAEISAASSGYELRIKDLAAYQKQKKALLAEDPNLILLHLLCQQVPNVPEKTAEATGLSSQTFTKQTRYIEGILAHYGLILDKKKWQIVGPEANIRIFYNAFYFREKEQPYTIFKHLSDELSLKVVPEVKLDTVQAEQWLKVFLLRAKQGGCLPERPEMIDVCRLLLQKTGFQAFLFNKPIAFAEQELAILLILTMDEEALLSFLMQNAWIKAEVPVDLDQVLKEILGEKRAEMADDQVLLHMTLATILLDRLFHVPIKQPAPEATIVEMNRKSVGENRTGLTKAGYHYFADLAKTYLNKQTHLKKQLLIDYQIAGPRKIHQWVKRELNDWLAQQGIRVISEQKNAYSFLKASQVIVTDHQLLFQDPYTPVYTIDRSLEKESIHQLGQRILNDFQQKIDQNDWVPSKQGFLLNAAPEKGRGT